MLISNFRGRSISSDVFRILTVVILCVILSFINNSFFTLENILNILRQMSILLILSLGSTLVIITAGIDLSLGGVMAVVGCFSAQMLSNNYPCFIVIICGLIIGFLFGAANGFLVGYINIPPFVATYGIMWIANGLALILMQGQIIFGLSKEFRFFATGHIGILPVIVIITTILTLIVSFITNKTVFGKHVFALGANKNSAYYSGINIRLTLVLVYAISGITAGIAGMLQTGRLDAAEASMGESFQMLAIASVVIGGTSLLGGEGGIGGTVIGALILTLVVNGMNLLDVPSLAQPLVTGAVILIAVFSDVITKSRR